MTTEEMIIVMQEWLDGKEIEVRLIGTKKWLECQDPEWDWSKMDYRVKPEPPKPTYVPYESAQEFLEAQREHGPYVELFPDPKGINRLQYYSIPFDVANNEVFFAEDSGGGHVILRQYSYQRLCEECKWQDGTPVGYLEEE